jgi:hypothetical protein
MRAPGPEKPLNQPHELEIYMADGRINTNTYGNICEAIEVARIYSAVPNVKKVQVKLGQHLMYEFDVEFFNHNSKQFYGWKNARETKNNRKIFRQDSLD